MQVTVGLRMLTCPLLDDGHIPEAEQAEGETEGHGLLIMRAGLFKFLIPIMDVGSQLEQGVT